MNPADRLMLENRAWAHETIERDPDLLMRLSTGQHPEILWIGCCDSRVPAEAITNCEPGDLFVHRNIANLVIDSDPNLMSVLQYAIAELKVKHVIVCGHLDCGGVRASMNPPRSDLAHVNRQLEPLRQIYRNNLRRIDELDDGAARLKYLVELNVREQVDSLSRTWIVQSAWKDAALPVLHGWVFDILAGNLSEIVRKEPRGDTASLEFP
jgi:carbonic anhydrase